MAFHRTLRRLAEPYNCHARRGATRLGSGRDCSGEHGASLHITAYRPAPPAPHPIGKQTTATNHHHHHHHARTGHSLSHHQERSGGGTMSEGTREMRRLRGGVAGSGKSSGSGIVADEWNTGGRCIDARIRGVNVGILDEQVLVLVFRALNWDPQALCSVARVSRRLRAVAERVLWRELCVSRAPRMVSALTAASSSSAPMSGRVGGGWPALAKMLLYCCGAAVGVPGHFAPVSRFSKTSGRSFLSRRCGGDLLYVSDPCEHPVPGGRASEDDDVGAYRGVFRGFMRSCTRACLVGGRAPLEPRVRCPYCGARVWSVTAAGLAPRSACRRLGAHEGRLEYFVCVSGHLHGSCWLARLSDSDGEGPRGGSGSHSDDGFASEEEDDRRMAL